MYDSAGPFVDLLLALLASGAVHFYILVSGTWNTLTLPLPITGLVWCAGAFIYSSMTYSVVKGVYPL